MKIPVDSESNNFRSKYPKDSDNKQLKKTSDLAQNMTESTFPHYKRVSDYLLGTCIGEGSFAKVRVGFHCPTKEKVAIKIINKAKAKKDSYVFRNLHREGKIMQQLYHPNVVQVFDILETGNNYYLVTELCEGGELIDIVTEQGSLPEETVRKYTFQLVNAVAYLHERKIIHRDLKVENLLLDSDDNIKIIDFGLSNTIPPFCDDVSTSLSTQCGSPAYAAPELLSKQSYGPKVDVWSIGVITFALLVGKLPFTVEPFHISKLCKKMMRGEMNAIPTYVTSQCRYFIRKLLLPDQQQRPAINDVIRLKWISMYQVRNKSNLKLSGPSLNGMRLNGELNFHLSNGFKAPPIDSSVVKEMTSLGFTTSEAIQCIQNNRPGPALATYYLLLKRLKIKQKQKEESAKFVKTHIQIKMPKEPVARQKDIPSDSHSLDEEAITPDSQDSPSSTKNLIATPPLPKIRTPERESPSSTDQKIKQSNFLKRTPTEPNTSQENGEKTEKTNEIYNNKPNWNQERARILFTSKNATKTFHKEIKDEPTHNKVTSMRHKEEEQPREKNEPQQTSPQKEVDSKSPEITKNKQLPKVTDINELLSSMRKARQVLEKRQKLQHRNSLIKHNHDSNRCLDDRLTIGNKASKPSSSPSSSPKPEKDFANVTLRKPQSLRIPTKFANEPRCTSQQETRLQSDGSYEYHPSYQRPASHNAVLSRKSGNTVAVTPRLYVYTPTSASKSRGTPTWLRHDKNEVHDRERTHLAALEHRRAVPTSLPVIVPKSKVDPDPIPNRLSPQKLNTQSRSVRRTLPLSNGQYNTANGFSVTSPNKNQESMKRDRKSFDSKISVVSRWQHLTNNEHSTKPSYYYTNQSENRSVSTRRPKRVISEPIAAAISYLTSTKNRTLRKEKTPFMTSR